MMAEWRNGGKSGKREKGHIPFRDRASQWRMKKMHERETVGELEEIASEGERSQSTQEEPEQEPDKIDELVQEPDPSAVDGIAERWRADDDEEEAHAEELSALQELAEKRQRLYKARKLQPSWQCESVFKKEVTDMSTVTARCA